MRDRHAWFLFAFWVIMTVWMYLDKQPFFILLAAGMLGYTIAKLEG